MSHVFIFRIDWFRFIRWCTGIYYLYKKLIHAQKLLALFSGRVNFPILQGEVCCESGQVWTKETNERIRIIPPISTGVKMRSLFNGWRTELCWEIMWPLIKFSKRLGEHSSFHSLDVLILFLGQNIRNSRTAPLAALLSELPSTSWELRLFEKDTLFKQSYTQIDWGSVLFLFYSWCCRAAFYHLISTSTRKQL